MPLIGVWPYFVPVLLLAYLHLNTWSAGTSCLAKHIAWHEACRPCVWTKACRLDEKIQSTYLLTRIGRRGVATPSLVEAVGSRLHYTVLQL